MEIRAVTICHIGSIGFISNERFTYLDKRVLGSHTYSLAPPLSVVSYIGYTNLDEYGNPSAGLLLKRQVR